MAGLLMDHPDGFSDWLGRIPSLTSPAAKTAWRPREAPYEWIRGVRPTALVAWRSTDGVLLGFAANRFVPELVQSTAALIYRLSANGQAAATVSAGSVALVVAGIFVATVPFSAMNAWRVRGFATDEMDWRRTRRRARFLFVVAGLSIQAIAAVT